MIIFFFFFFFSSRRRHTRLQGDWSSDVCSSDLRCRCPRHHPRHDCLGAASDFLANTGVNYLNPLARGLEPGDSVTISGAKQILCDTFASAPGDYVRVLTAFSPTAATVPEPGSPSLLGSGL